MGRHLSGLTVVARLEANGVLVFGLGGYNVRHRGAYNRPRSARWRMS